MNTTPANDQVAKTILAQLGGAARFGIMTGARDFMHAENALHFRLAKAGKRGINRVKIALDAGTDTYAVTYYAQKRGGFDCPIVCESPGVHAGELARNFTAATGLYTSL